MKHKKVTTLEKIVSRKLHKLGISRARIDEGCGFAYDTGDESVYFTVFDDPMDIAYAMIIREDFGLDISHIDFAFSLLHEVGHHHTIYDFSRAEMTGEAIQRATITLTDGISIYERQRRYMELPSEQAANEWAVNYARTHKEEVEKLQALLAQRLRHHNRKFL